MMITMATTIDRLVLFFALPFISWSVLSNFEILFPVCLILTQKLVYFLRVLQLKAIEIITLGFEQAIWVVLIKNVCINQLAGLFDLLVRLHHGSFNV